MNDRFKFRVWDKERKCFFNDDEVVICPNGEESFFNADYDFTECVVEQCTGLEDKNGRLIYEGDILKCIHSDIMKYKIYWAKFCGFRMKVYGTNNRLVDDCNVFNDESILEIIGNIHENKELLDD